MRAKRHHQIIVYTSLFVIGLSIAWIFWMLRKPNTQPKPKIVSPEVEIVVPVKKATAPACVSYGTLPDKICTPGAVNPKIEQKDIKNTICDDGYLRKVQPSQDFMEKTKQALLKTYGIEEDSNNYELDHLIPIELGGNPTTIENLWPQIVAGTKGSRAKNGVEQKLHDEVCRGERGLRLTQSAMASDWTKVE